MSRALWTALPESAIFNGVRKIIPRWIGGLYGNRRRFAPGIRL